MEGHHPMIAHTHPRVEPTPTLADYPLTVVANLARQAAHALRHQAARLGGRYYSPATLRTIRDNAMDDIHTRALEAYQASGYAPSRDNARIWMANEPFTALNRWAGVEGPHPVTDRYLNAVARDELHTRAATLDGQRTAWLQRQNPLTLGEILAGAQHTPIEYALRSIITSQTLRDELHQRATAEYQQVTADPARRARLDAYRQQAAWYLNAMDQSCYVDPAVRAAIQDTIHATVQQQQ
jgi:hypothetical protein